MQIFKAEKSIASIQNNKTIALTASIKVTEEKTQLLIDSLEFLKTHSSPKISKAIEKISTDNHPDLMYGSAILVSTVMNKNDDIFLTSETWAARNTPINTPYNENHEESDIIGHIINSYPLNSKGEDISQLTEPPDYFDIGVDFVMYKEIFPVIAEKIAVGAENDTAFVSMECVFESFDYGLVDIENNIKIVKRNESTAFLTKYLRAYGGNGLYDNNRIGRVLRNFRFSGMGNVEKPANPKSEYTKIASASVIEFLEKKLLHITKGMVMTIENMDQAKVEIEKLVKAQEDLSKQIDTLTSEKKSLTEKLSAEELKTSTLQKTSNEATAALDQMKVDLKLKADDVAKLNKALKGNERYAQLKELNITLDDAKKDAVAGWSDEQYTQVIEFAKALKSNIVKDAEEGKSEADETLDNAEHKKTPDVTKTGGDNTTSEQKVQEVAEKLVASLRKQRKTAAKTKKE